MRALTPEQQQAVERRTGSLLLAAGAGSGKTSVLVERFVRAVLDDGIAPGRILAITFTERAAGELRGRVRARFLELEQREAARDTEAAQIGTFHGFCARLLRTHPLLAGVDPDFTILEEGLAGRLRLKAFRVAASDLLAREGEPGVDLLAAYGIDRLRGMVLGAHAELRSRGHSEPRLPSPSPRGEPTAARAAVLARLDEVERELLAAHAARPGMRLEQALERLAAVRELSAEIPAAATLIRLRLPGSAAGVLASPACEAYREALERFIEACADAQGARACALIDVLLQRFSYHYAELKQARAALDFDDLELRARALLGEHADVRASWSERLELLMVDEFQDTNHRQLSLLAMLERDNLFTVGDELQSIYGFRHADVEIFRARRRELEAHDASLVLARNFRARPPLIEVVNRVFAARFGERFTPLEPGREPNADYPAGRPRVELLLTDRQGWEGERGSVEWREAEARALARRVVELVGEGTPPGDVAVLLRALGDLPLFERALQEQGLATLASVGSFYTQQQVGDLLAYLRVLDNPLDELALHSVLASPLVGLTSEALVLLARAARAGNAGLWATASRPDGALSARVGSRASERLSEFVAHVEGERAIAPGLGVAELLRRGIAACHYEQHVLRLAEPERRLANVHKLLRLARTYEGQEGRDLRGFLEHVSHQQDFMAGSEPQAPVADGEPDAVRLMSIHAAKGLEFPVVCLADLGRGANLGLPDLLLDEQRVGLRLVEIDGPDSVPSLAFEALAEQRRRREAEEEERIVYVAMTRARERLLLSGGVDFGRWPEARPGAAPIAWLGPALLADLPERVSAAAIGVEELPGLRLQLNVPPSRLQGQLELELGLEDPVSADAPADPAASSNGASSDSPDGTDAARTRPAPAASPSSSPSTVASIPALVDPAGSLSYTALSELERCGYRYYLERVLGLPEERAALRSQPGTGAIEGRARGRIVHRLLESFDFVTPVAPSAADVAAVARELGARVGPREREEIAELVGEAAGTDLARRLGTGARVRRELPFAFPSGVDDTLIEGVLDALVEQPGGPLLIVDYKSDQLAPGQDLEALTEHEYGLQRLIYALAALHEGAREVEIVHWFLRRPAEWVTARYGAHERGELHRLLAERIEHARALGFAVSDTPHRSLCLTCPGRGGMCSWGEAETLRELPQAVGVAVGESN